MPRASRKAPVLKGVKPLWQRELRTKPECECGGVGAGLPCLRMDSRRLTVLAKPSEDKMLAGYAEAGFSADLLRYFVQPAAVVGYRLAALIADDVTVTPV